MSISTEFKAHRPPQYTGRGDAYLPGIIKELRQLLAQTQQEFSYDTLYLPPQKLTTLAHILVEFGEDIYHNIGIWSALEQYNQELFGTPLPLTKLTDPTSTPDTTDRVHHLLWNLYPQLDPDLILGPQHQDLGYLALVVATFLDQNFSNNISPAKGTHSGVKRFLNQPNKFGWEVKHKLVWLGQHSYLFRVICQNYVAAEGGEADIETIDGFICQETTPWSGLGVIDILAGLLPLSPAQQKTLRGWYQRHFAFYQIKSVKKGNLKVINLINNKPYKVRMDEDVTRFKPGTVIFGGLLPWGGRWYWSGQQQIYHTMSTEVKQSLPETMRTQSARLVYRYHQPWLTEARETLQHFHHTFTRYHNNDLAIYPHGIAMAGDMQKMYRLHNEAALKAEKADFMKKHNLTSTTPQMPYPPELVQTEDGVAVFFNPAEGTEIFNHFDTLVSALQKEGKNLSEDEYRAIHGLIESPNLSPAFVQRLLQEYNDSSIARVYIIKQPPSYYLAYLLRQHKGHFYRTRYPNVALQP